MKIKEIQAKSILRKHKKIDSWFISQYGMNLYRGCIHNCVYCDGRSEKYKVDGEFGREVIVKINAIDLLRKELEIKKRRIPLKKSYIMIGGGVGDSYQPVEKKYELTKKTLELLYKKNLPISILTKSTLVKRDIDIIKRINEKNKAIVSFSFSSTDDKISSIFEPGVPPPGERLKTIEFFKNADILTFDSQYTLEESFNKVDWGHSSIQIGIDIANHSKINKIVLFHYDPTYSDQKINEIVKIGISYKNTIYPESNIEIIPSYEGLELEL